MTGEPPPTPEIESEKLSRAGVPIGGVGAGYIEFGPDGWFRNITINNNRTPATQIACAARSFLALRVERANARLYSRILQAEVPEAPAWRSEAAPDRLKAKHLGWRGLYPVANYILQDSACPVRVVWSAFSPIIPFDYDASVLPMILFGVRCENLGDEEAVVSVMLNFESLNGRTAAIQEPAAGPGAAIMALEEQPKLVTSPGRRHTTGKDGELETPPPPRHNGVEMGSPDAPPSAAHGHYCIAGRPAEGLELSVLPWDYRDERDEHALWTQFRLNGNLEKAKSESGAITAGAVCAQFTLPPRASGRADFVITWYCPRFEIDGVDQGNGYTNRMKNAVEVAKAGVRNVDYYYASVEGWRGRLKASNLPRWLNDSCINSCHVLTTNALFTRDGRFGLMEGATDGRAGRLHLRRYHSLGSLLFFPRFEDNELATFAAAEDPLREKRFPAGMGVARLDQPDFKDVDGLQVDLISEFVLSAYRIFCFTGNPARLKALLPRINEAMLIASGRDKDGDGLPEIAPLTRTFDGIQLQGLNVITCGLWLAALRAYLRIAEHLRLTEEFARYRAIHQLAQRAFEKYFWDERNAFYRLCWDPRLPADQQPPQSSACHSAQLTGQWYADFLGLGTLHDRGRVARALETLERNNERTFGLLSAVYPDGRTVENADGAPCQSHFAWPAFATAHYACMQIQRGNVSRGMRLLEKTYRNTLYKHDRAFNCPDKWDITLDCAPAAQSVDRHVAVLSVWYVLYALTGLELNMSDACIRIMPRLPRGVHSLETLLFTPACLGWLRYQEDEPGAYRQRLQLSLDSPITLQRIELRLPKGVQHVAVNCEVPDGAFETTHVIEPVENAQRLIITAKRPIIANSALSVEVVSIPAPPISQRGTR